MVRVSLTLAILVGVPASAAACPFCGGSGASGLLENLLLVVAVWFGARTLVRAARKRARRASEASAPADSAAESRS